MSFPSQSVFRPIALSIGVLLLGSAIGMGAEPEKEFSAADLEFFEKEVRPILVQRCYECHSQQTKEPKGGLRVDSRHALLTGGDTGPAVVPGDARKSLFIDAINYGDTYQMPPKSRLPAAEVATLTKWVERGAPWPKEAGTAAKNANHFDLDARRSAHWCWKEIGNYSPPSVKTPDWPRQELDHFILSKLEERGLAPAPQADRHTLLRRVYFDLIGLPPTPEEVQAFLSDSAPDSFEKVVDRLLKSPHFGERWARHWMDLVRYAETCGHEFDYPIPHAWRYRDYLIRAFNADVPYDQFVIEHIAGDLLQNPRLHPDEGWNESIIGTAFWWLHEAIHAPVDIRLDHAGRIDNQIDVFSKTFLGLTVACARCHDHKFDAISTKDYYALAGFLRSTRRQEAMLDPGQRISKSAESVLTIRKDAESALGQAIGTDTGLTGETLRQYLLATRELKFGQRTDSEGPPEEGQRRNLAAVAKQFGVSPEGLKRWQTALADPQVQSQEHPLRAWWQLGLNKEAPLAASDFDGFKGQIQTEQAELARRMSGFSSFANFDSPAAYSDWKVTGQAFSQAPWTAASWDPSTDAVQFLAINSAHSGQLSHKFQGVLRSPTFTIEHKNIFYRIAGQNCEVRLIIDGYNMLEFHQLLFGGCKFPVNTEGKWVWHRQAGDLNMYQGHRAYIEVVDPGDGWVAIDDIVFSNDEQAPSGGSVALAAEMTTAAADSVQKLADVFANYWTAARKRWQSNHPTADDVRFTNWLIATGLIGDAGQKMTEVAASAKKKIEEAVRELPAPVKVIAAMEGTGENSTVYIRGNPRTPGDEAQRQLLVAIVGNQPPVSEGSGRLTLAHQIVDPKNPLTARVMVNRVWHHLFGSGIVSSVDNFGVLGDEPTHPELLDYLSQQFMQEGWSLKKLLRTIVLSRTYQMSSASTPAADEADPLNRLLHRTNIRRLEGEAIRDSMLAISGRLDARQFGPGVPVFITPFMQGRGKPSSSGPIDGEGRRSVYTEVRRNFLPPMMLAFDTPIPFNTVGRRNASNVPAQALILMNDPFVSDQARLWAKRLLADQSLTFEQRVSRAYFAAIARAPTDQELAEVRDFLNSQVQEHGPSGEKGMSDEKVWSDLCHVLFNVKEFLFLE